MDKLSVVEAPAPYMALPDSSSKLFKNYHVSDKLPLPAYLQETYWWAYIHPKGVRFFERQWLVNLILWGNFSHLRDMALDEMGRTINGRTLQVACVYGDFTPRVANRMTDGAHLDVVDVAPVQLDNLSRKLNGHGKVHLHHQDSTNLAFEDDSFDQSILFFLLHEQPAGVRERTIAEALRVTKPGGKVVFVDYHRPAWYNPFRYVMIPILRTLEPFAMDLWQHEIEEWLPAGTTIQASHKSTHFGGLYQKVVLTP